MKITDTMSGVRSDVGGRNISIYLCGITVYDRSHIGHARTIVVFDVLRRHLELDGTAVKIVQNFTDVDDKIIARAADDGISARELSEKYIQEYHDCFDALNIKRAAEYPRATEHIQDMVDFISKLVESDFAYATENGAYFAVEKFSKYGRLSKKNTEDLQSGARVEVDESKRSPLDFALWKNSALQPSWDSPWGRGRPGWHIECSVMSKKYLGETFDIHGGGRDLIFPHHENEIAQSESASGKAMANTWMHVGMVTVNGEKMSKSVGNVRPVAGLLERRGPNVIRLFCLGAHYSKPVDYTEELLDEHGGNWDRARLAYHMSVQYSAGTGGDLGEISKFKDEFNAALDDDLNTHGALVALNGLASYCIGLGAQMSQDTSGHVRAIFDHMFESLGLAIKIPTAENIARINGMLEKRGKLREQKKYAEADAIRDELDAMNVEIKDESGRTLWLVKDIFG